MNTKRFLALLLTLVMCFTVISPSTFALADEEVQDVNQNTEGQDTTTGGGASGTGDLNAPGIGGDTLIGGGQNPVNAPGTDAPGIPMGNDSSDPCAEGHAWDLDHPVWGIPNADWSGGGVTITFNCVNNDATTTVNAPMVGMFTEASPTCGTGGYSMATFETTFEGRTFRKQITWDVTEPDGEHEFYSEYPAVPATCTEAGNNAYYQCAECGKFFSDENMEKEIAENSWVIPAGHSLTEHPAVAATATTAGNSQYWECSVCNKYFSDANGETEIEADSWVIEALGAALPAVNVQAAQINGVEKAYSFTFTGALTDDQKAVYGTWNCDYVVSFDAPVAAGKVTFYGQSAVLNDGAGVSIVLPNDLAKDGGLPLVAGLGRAVNLMELELIQPFNCGVTSNDPDATAGIKMTVKLVMTNATTGETKVINVTEYTFPTYVAQVGEDQFASLPDAIEAAASGATVTLLDSIDISAPIVVKKKITLDLNGKTISNTTDIWNSNTGDWSLISVQAGGDLTITGNGKLLAKDNDCFAVDVCDGAKLTILNGEYKGNISAIYAYEGTVTIRGGRFYIHQLSQHDDYRFTLNCLDASYSGTSDFTVTGGTFAHFDPNNNLAEGANTDFVPAGYKTVEADDWYTVEANTFTYGGYDVAAPAVPENEFADAAEAEKPVTVETNTATVVFNAEAAAAIATAADGNVTLTVANVTTQAESQENIATFEITLTDANDAPVFTDEAAGAKATVTVSYVVTEGSVPKVNLVVGETKTPVTVVSWTASTVTFEAPHFSQYEVSQEAATVSVTKNDVTKYYDDLANAISEAEAGSTVTLLDDVTLTSTLTIDKALTLTSDAGHTHTITSSAAAAVLVKGTGAVTIDGVNITATTGHGIQAGDDSDDYSGALTFENATMTVAKRGIRVYSENTGFGITVTNATIQSSVADPTTTYTTGNDSMGLSLGATDKNDANHGYAVAITNSTIKGFSYCINGVTSGSNLTVSMTGGATYGRAAVNFWGNYNNITLDGVTVTGINNQTGSTEAFSCIVDNSPANGNTYNINNCTFYAKLSSAAANTSGSSASEELFDLRGTNSVIHFTGSNSYTPTVAGAAPTEEQADRFGLVTVEGGLAANTVTFDSTSAAGLSEEIAALSNNVGTQTSGTTTTLNYDPEVYYFWNTGNGIKGTYCGFNDPFDEGWLDEGEFIGLMKNVALTKDLNPAVSFSLLLDGHTLTPGAYKIAIAAGKTVTSDTAGLTVFSAPAGSYIVETEVTENETTSYVYSVKLCAAKIDETYYNTLAEAIAAVPADGTATINMLTDDTVAAPIVLEDGQTITIDLAGNTVSGAYVDLYNAFLTVTDSAAANEKGAFENLVYVNVAADETLAAGTHNNFTLAAGATMNNNVYVYQNDTAKGYGSAVTISGTMNGLIFVLGNIHEGNTLVTVNGTINSSDDVAIALNGCANVVVNEGAHIDAQDENGKGTAIEVRAGSLTVNGGTITGHGTPTLVNPNGSGTTSTGAGIAVSQHTTKLPISVTIKGGEISGYSAVYESNPQNNTAEDIGKIALAIKDGTFTTTEGGTVALYSEDAETIGGFVSGGTFSSAVPEAYCATGFTPVTTAVNGMYTVEHIKVAKIGNTEYETLADAIAAVPANGTATTITMIADEAIDVSGYALTIPANKNVVLDLNGKTISGNNATESTSALIRNLGTLKIQDSSQEKTGAITLSVTTPWVYSEANPGGYASNLIRNEGTLVVNSGTFTNNGTGSACYAIDNYSAGEVTINGGTLETASAAAVRLFYNNGGSITVNDGTIGSDNSWMGIQVMSGDNADVTINGGTFNGDTYSIYTYGGGDSTVEINGGTFEAPAIMYYAPVSISGGTFNGTGSYGSAYIVYADEVTITNGETTVPTFADTVCLYPSNAENADWEISGGSFAEGVQDWNMVEGYISGGVFTDEPDPETVVRGKAATVRDGDGKYIIGDAVAEIGTVGYISLEAALQYAEDDDTIVMLADEVLTSYVTFPADKTITLDLAGRNVTRDGNCALDVYGNVTLKDSGRDDNGTTVYGKLESGVPVWVNNGGTFTLTSGAINAVGSSPTGILVEGNGKAYLNGGSVTSTKWGVTAFNTATVTVNGATITATNDAAIATNGNAGQGATVNIVSGTVTSTNDIAIYAPSGTLNISGGTITGATAVYFKSTNLNITGGTLTGNGAAADYSYNGNGANATGDALVLDNCGYPNGVETYEVTGGTFISTNAQAVASYASQDQTALGGFISGGEFSNEVPKEYCYTGYSPVTTPNTNGRYGVEVENATARYGVTLTLNNNIDVNFYMWDLSEAAAGYTVEVTFKGITTTTALTEMDTITSGNTTLYTLVASSCRAEQMGEKVTIRVLYAGTQIWKIEDYSVKAYCEYQLSTSKDQTLIDLCKATLAYGAIAQEYFDHDTEHLVTDDYFNVNANVSDAISDTYNKLDTEYTGTAFKNAGATLTLASETEVNFYFQPLNGKTIDDYTFTATKGGAAVTVTPTMYGGWIQVTIKGFAATELNDAVVVIGRDNASGDNWKITYSPLSWACYMQQNADNREISQALYYYYLAANAFFEAHP